MFTHTHTYIYISYIYIYIYVYIYTHIAYYTWITQDNSVAKTSTQLKLAFWEGDKNVLAHTMEKPMGYSPLGTVGHICSKKKKSEFSLYLSILCSSLLAQISSSLQEMADVATGKSALHPSSPKALLEKHAFFSVI